MKGSFSIGNRVFPAALASAALLFTWAFAAPDASAGYRQPGMVTISGTAYAFFDIDDRIPGGVVKVDEFPDIASPVMASGPDTELDATVNKKAHAKGQGKKRKVKLGFKAGEQLTARLVVKRGKRRISPPKTKPLDPGKRALTVKIRKKAGPGRAKAKLEMTDPAGNSEVATRKVRIPR